jgi:hypothetical protein
MTDSQKMVLECLSDEPDQFHSTHSIRRKCGREMISAILALERAGAVESNANHDEWRLIKLKDETT